MRREDRGKESYGETIFVARAGKHENCDVKTQQRRLGLFVLAMEQHCKVNEAIESLK
jgi:hypothetical protein